MNEVEEFSVKRSMHPAPCEVWRAAKVETGCWKLPQAGLMPSGARAHQMRHIQVPHGGRNGQVEPCEQRCCEDEEAVTDGVRAIPNELI